MESEIIEIRYPHEVSELICLKCLDRWIGVTAVGVPLKDISLRRVKQL